MNMHTVIVRARFWLLLLVFRETELKRKKEEEAEVRKEIEVSAFTSQKLFFGEVAPTIHYMYVL